ncbi:hypothetical protein BELL_0409g00010 [Botrytis elliptica]|uniref:Clr5 domain-containing protein n=1 Tax=Botrytis elliptica TaxID=278938 RepID=A0A4Z1JHS9_9HELO|nr:hypothetical protein EAE99_005226 [Botrytis elliptica]TGO72884.1 hypothetical protein BELL_0409g00010 [Botrytis elliptica]
MASSISQELDPYFLSVPYAKRWDLFQPTIRSLYVDNNRNVTDVARIMKEDYKFSALEHQYKYYLKKWNLTKSVPKEKKEAAVTALGKRVRDDSISTTVIKYKGGEIDKKRLRRHIVELERTHNKNMAVLYSGGNTFIRWNLPYRAFSSSTSAAANHRSPYWTTDSTPSDISVVSPSANRIGGSPFINGPSLSDAPSPTVLVLRGKFQRERTDLFLGGDHEKLLQRMGKRENMTLTTWLYQFWLFSFKTAKYWGVGPRNWTSDILEFDRYRDKVSPSLSNTPNFNGEIPATPRSSAAIDVIGESSDSNRHPAQLCRWAIHANIGVYYSGISSPGSVYSEGLSDSEDSESGEPESEDWENGDLDTRDPDTWKRWQANRNPTNFARKLKAALKNNLFSNICASDLPITTTSLTEAAKTSSSALLMECFGFAIMTRNPKLFWKILPRIETTVIQNSNLYPLHLATSFLDGSKTCCIILDALVNQMGICNSVRKLFINDRGHTVLDNLMMAILKSHTSCPPVTVDDSFKDLNHWSGEEVDICGRWDADSPCVRSHLAEGNASIPIGWKHMFCHTSVQTICHCIGRIFGPSYAPKIGTPSGLFMKHCQKCGHKLQLLPLHSLVLVAFHLAQSGCEDENLFGILAVLVCLLANGANPLDRAAISMKALRGQDNADECSHELLEPIDIADKIPSTLMSSWTSDARLGWAIFCSVLRYAGNERRSGEITTRSSANTMNRGDDFSAFLEYGSDSDVDMNERSDDEDENEAETETDSPVCDHDELKNNFYGRSDVVGKLWAAVQTELLTYRRLEEGDSWLSSNFDMLSLLDGIPLGFVSLPLLDNDMLNPFCRCGRFIDVHDEACVCVDEACSHYFSNLEYWERSAYIVIPEGGM